MSEKEDSEKGAFDFDKLQLKSPFIEFEDYVQERVQTAERLGNKEEVALYLDALELGRRFLSKKIGGIS